MPDEDNSMRIFLGGDPEPSMKDFENLDAFKKRMKLVEKYVKKLDALQEEVKSPPSYITEKNRLDYFFHRDLMGIALEAIKHNIYWERPFIDKFVETAEFVLLRK